MFSLFCLYLHIFTLMKKIYTNVLQIVPMRKRGYRQIKACSSSFVYLARNSNFFKK